MRDLGGIAGSLCAPGCIQDGGKGGAGGPKSFKVADLQSENKARAHGAVMGGGGVSANGRRFSKNITGTLQFDRAVLAKVWLRFLNNATGDDKHRLSLGVRSRNKFIIGNGLRAHFGGDPL